MVGGGEGIVMIPALDHTTTLSRARIHGTSTLINAVRETVAFWQAGPPERSKHVQFSCLSNRLCAAIDAQLVENLSDMPFDRRYCYN